MSNLLRNTQFWLALVAVAQTVIFQFFPAFSPELWKAIDAVIAILIASLTASDVTTTVMNAKVEMLKMQMNKKQ